MAQECADQYQSFAAISSYTPPSWLEPIVPYNCHYPSSNIMSSSDDHQGEHFFSMSTNCFTDSSNHFGLIGVDSSRRNVAGRDRRQPREIESMDEHVSDGQLWAHILLGGRSNLGELGNDQEVGDNLVGANLSSNNNSTSSPLSHGVMFEPVYDYLKKMDNDWEFSSSSSSSNKNSTFRMQVNESTSPPPHHDPGVLPCNDLNQFDPYNSYGIGGKKNNNNNNNNNPSFLPLLYNHGQQLDHVKIENEIEDSGSIFRRSFSFNDPRYDIGININDNPVAEDYCNKYYCGTPASCSSARNLIDSVVLNERPSEALGSNIKAGARSSARVDCKKQGIQSPKQGGKRHGAQSNEGKKKRISEEASSTALKKPKQDSSIATKIQAPKQKFAEKVTTLQQIVSPFGKTDTASVLLEAIQYIKCLQEQVQLLSNPYMKNAHKEHWPGSLQIKESGDHYAKVDLRSKGLSLVPTWCIPQVYQESAGSDYWTPPYRTCLYR